MIGSIRNGLFWVIIIRKISVRMIVMSITIAKKVMVMLMMLMMLMMSIITLIAIIATITITLTLLTPSLATYLI